MTTYGGTFAFLNNWIKRYGVDVDKDLPGRPGK
jgi:hypothetical protein